MVNPELAVAPMHRVCKKAGADRVSEAAAKELAKVLEDIGIKIAKEAIDYVFRLRIRKRKPLVRKYFTF